VFDTLFKMVSATYRSGFYTLLMMVKVVEDPTKINY